MDKSIGIIKQIEQTHKGLGIPILFGIIAILGKISVLYVGEIGTGKGTAIRSIKAVSVKQRYDFSMNAITLSELVSQIGVCSNEIMLWRFPEWSTLSKYHRELFLTVGAHIITDKTYYHQMGEKKGIPVVIDIKNCDLISLIGIQPLKMSRMMSENENWESLASDRFIKFAMFNPLRQDTTESLPTYELPDGLHYWKDMEIRTEMNFIKKLLGAQISEERLPIFCRHLLRAYCSLEGYSVVDLKAELEFIKLFRPYLDIYPKMIYTQDIEEEKTFAGGAYRLFLYVSKHDGCTLEDVRANFHVYNKIHKSTKQAIESYEKMIVRHASLLQEMGLLNFYHDSPLTFHMTQKMKDYFDWYRSVSS